MVPILDCKRQYEALKVELDRAISGVLASGWFVLGREVAAFEEEFAAWCGARFCVGVGSGLDALELSLRALGIGRGKRVLCPANVIFGPIAAERAGAEVVLCDVNDETGLMKTPDIAGSVDAVIPVHLYGQMADMREISAFAESAGAKVIEDACQAHGASLCGRKAGTWGDIGCFSFYPSKNLGAFGEGGAILTNDEGLRDTICELRNYGKSSRYEHRLRGTNARLDEMQAAILRVKLRRLNEWNERRREIAERYRAAFREAPIKCIETLSDREHAWHLFVVRTPERDRLRNHLENRGIGTQIHYPIPVHLQPAFADLGFRAGSFPTCERFCGEILSLPLFPELEESEIRQVIDAVNEW
ncbi:MAG TPA: DegT/DnrJ/EryC1/StrS family aminotransferase [Candidatus Brocadiia bacterium]|nr:DegT/DnrJ/EryC1/StrS family aminotransferase [Candidatus Brocadiia bacterium]